MMVQLITVRARPRLRNREDEPMKIVHVGAVRPGAFDHRDNNAFVVSRWATSIFY
ncbi:hypothetical protein CsatB_002956 [Cannabis sativa]